MTIIQVNEIPENVNFNSIIEIVSNNVNYFTHGFFKYPCKFIPQIPRWAILKYTKPKDRILDPFAGSGTTLVEAVLNNRNAIGIDFDKFSQLLCEVKTTHLSSKQIKLLKQIKDTLFLNDEDIQPFKPDLHNVTHWFPPQNILDLGLLRSKIERIYQKTNDKEIYNFLLVCLASIIRKCSWADDVSPKPYVSRRIKKEPSNVKEAFLRIFDTYIKRIEEYKVENLGRAIAILGDARQIDTQDYISKVSLAVTSPPYINAFDYVRSLRLENAWLGFYGDSKIIEMKKKQVGTEIIPHQLYAKGVEKTGNKRLDDILTKIEKKDKKRAYIVKKFFEDMGKNIEEVNKLLKSGGHYIIVIGDSKIRGVHIPTHEILIDIAKERGFELSNVFSYIIRNRYLRIPRSGRGGLIKKDWVVDIVKRKD